MASESKLGPSCKQLFFLNVNLPQCSCDRFLHVSRTYPWLGHPVTEMLPQEGVEGLRKLPGLGERLTRTIHDLVVTGRRLRLDRLRGEMDPVSRFASGPGIGTVLAEYLQCDLGMAMLEALASAAHDGRLAEIAGLGRRRWQGS